MLPKLRGDQVTIELLERIAAVNRFLGHIDWTAGIITIIYLSTVICAGALSGIYVSTFPAGCSGGWIGGITGVVIGGCVVMRWHLWTFKSISKVLRDMSQKEKEKLIQAGKRVLLETTIRFQDYKDPRAADFLNKIYYEYSG